MTHPCAKSSTLRCRVLQGVVDCCSVSHCVAERHDVMTNPCAKYIVLQIVAVCCRVLQIVAEKYDVMTHS